MIREADLYDRTTRLILAEGQGTVESMARPLPEREAMAKIVARHLDRVPLRHLDRDGLPNMEMLIDADGYQRGKQVNAIATGLWAANAKKGQEHWKIWGDVIVQPVGWIVWRDSEESAAQA